MYSEKVIKEVLNIIDLVEDDVVIKGDIISCGNSKWMVLSDKDADKKTSDFIKNSLWAFRADFISNLTGYDKNEIGYLISKSELSNETVLSIIKDTCGLERFVSQAIKADSRGHFLSPYDGEEIEIYVDNEHYYLYRVN